MIRRYSGRRTQAEPFLTALERPHPVQPAPTAPQLFVGRAVEQTLARERLDTHGVVGLPGMAGSGKTALAATVASEAARRTHWVEVDPGFNDCQEAFLWQIAAPLATHAPQTWHALHRVQQSPWCYPLLVRLQMILDGYATQTEPVLVCLDNVERATDTRLLSLIVGLAEYVIQSSQTQFKLLLIGRTLPAPLELYALSPLTGLAPAAIKQWAEDLKIKLEAEHCATIAAYTGGLPQALMIVFSHLAVSADRLSLEHLAALPALRCFVQRLLISLPIETQQFLRLLAVRPDHVATTPLDLLPQLDLLERLGLARTTTAHTIAIHPLLQYFITYYSRKE